MPFCNCWVYNLSSGAVQRQLDFKAIIFLLSQTCVGKSKEFKIYLSVFLFRLYLEQSDFHECFSGGDFIVDRSSQSVTCQTFELTLRSCLYPHIERRYIECCGNLMKTLKKDYK